MVLRDPMGFGVSSRVHTAKVVLQYGTTRTD